MRIAAIILIGAIAGLDNMLSIRLAKTLAQFEQNPLGSMLIREFTVGGFVYLKAIGSLCCCAALLLARKHKRFWLVASPVVAVQLYTLGTLAGWELEGVADLFEIAFGNFDYSANLEQPIGRSVE